MHHIFPYILKVIICSGVFYLLYRLFIDRRTTFAFCRIYLLSSLLVSAVIPALRFKVWAGALIEIPAGMPAIPEIGIHIEEYASQQTGILTATSLIVILYSMVSLFFLAAMALQLHKIRRYRKFSRMTRHNGFRIFESDKISSPFTFLGSIFIPGGLSHSEREQIITHEAGHASHNHGAELMAMELIKALMWINPFVWLSRRSLAEVHEYEADNAVIEHGHDVYNYKNLLLRQLIGYSPDISNGFARSTTKKRFTMMDKKKPGRRSILRAAAVLPAMAGMLMLFSFTSKDATVILIPEVTQPEPNINITLEQSQIAEPPKLTGTVTLNGEKKNEMQITVTGSSISDTVRPPASPLFAGLEGKIIALYVNGVERKFDTNISLHPGNIESVEIMKSAIELEKHGKNGYDGIIKIKTKDFHGIDGKVAFYVDGAEMDFELFESIDRDRIESITVLKNAKDLDEHGKSGYDGIIKITTKDSTGQ